MLPLPASVGEVAALIQPMPHCAGAEFGRNLGVHWNYTGILDVHTPVKL